MFGTRRLAKRSIVGTRVAAKWQDGRFYPGVIKSEYAEETPFTDAVYSVLFEDGYEKHIPSKSIIGPGFQANTTCSLKPEQQVFLTLNGREVTGVVADHSKDIDEVIINVQLANGESVEVVKRLEEVRLTKSRKSARLLDQDTDYSKLADLHLNDNKKRTVSSEIDVPTSKPVRYRGIEHDDAHHDGSTPGVRVHRMSGGTGTSSEEGTEELGMMDENIAALVLTSLSCSPQSPQYNTSTDFRDYSKPSQLSTSASSSGFYSNQSEHSDPSPPAHSHLSESAPATSGMVFGPFHQDDGVDVEETIFEGQSSSENGSPKQMVKKTMYSCTWPGCEKITATCEAIEKHIRDSHLQSRMSEDSGGSSDSCGEEDFYYTEIEVNVDNVTQGFSHMYSTPSSPIATTNREQTNFIIPDHDYQKKEFRQGFASSVPSTSAFFGNSSTMPIPIKMTEIQRSLSWQNTHAYATSPSPPIRISTRPSPQERLQQHQAQSPKIHNNFSQSKAMSIHKKPRSEVRKCRKVYGMDNRDMWCTQCKWKKACTRFLD